jgi:hypothetical protein
MITAKKLREVLSYNQRTGVFTYKMHRRYGIGKGDTAGAVDRGSGYARIAINGRHYYSHRLAWLYVHGRWPSSHLDHVNGKPADNRIANLRKAAHKDNIRNAKQRSDNTSGFKGVCWHSAGRKWMARIVVNGRGIYLGLFTNAGEAHAAYRTAATQHFGEFARFK